MTKEINDFLNKWDNYLPDEPMMTEFKKDLASLIGHYQKIALKSDKALRGEIDVNKIS